MSIRDRAEIVLHVPQLSDKLKKQFLDVDNMIELSTYIYLVLY